MTSAKRGGLSLLAPTHCQPRSRGSHLGIPVEGGVQMTDMPIGMMWGMGLVWLLVVIILLLGIAACIKYLRS